MKKQCFMNKILIGTWAFLTTAFACAGTPVWTFKQLTPSSITVPINGGATIQYQVTNQSSKPHQLVILPIQGIKQNAPCQLTPRGFCILTLTVTGSNLPDGGISEGPVLCQIDVDGMPNPNLCYQPSEANSLNITKGPSAFYTVGGTITGLLGTVTLLNNGVNATSVNAPNTSFTFSTPLAEGNVYNVTIGTQPAGQTCAVTNGSGTIDHSNVTNVDVTCVTNATTITVSPTGTIPVNDGSGTLTVTNTGTTYAAVNVHAVLPATWTDVTQDSSDCASIAPNNGRCTLRFTSTTPYIAQDKITVTGVNVTPPPTTALAFTASGYLIWAVAENTVQVLASSNQPAAYWSLSNDTIPGITEESQSPPDACNGATDGACDSSQIVAKYGLPPFGPNYAAGYCYEITSDNTGSVAMGTWYLPAICQLGPRGRGANCAAGVANIYTNLVQRGFGDLSGRFWSSTEASGDPLRNAWLQDFSSGSQLVFGKTNNRLVSRCSRELTL